MSGFTRNLRRIITSNGILQFLDISGAYLYGTLAGDEGGVVLYDNKLTTLDHTLLPAPLDGLQFVILGNPLTTAASNSLGDDSVSWSFMFVAVLPLRLNVSPCPQLRRQ